MNCKEAHAALLLADVDELRGIGDSELALHIRECDACAAKASRILEANALLASALTSQARPRRAERRVLPVWLPIALAAAIAGLMLIDPTKAIAPPRVGNLEDVKRPVTVMQVNATPGQDVAVFQVSEKITVVWNLRAGGGS